MALPTKLTLNIVTPDHAYSHDVDEVSLPGTEGDFGVLPGHTPLFAALRTGQMYYRQGTVKHFLAVSIGFAEVLPDKVTVLAQVAERAEDLDQARAEAGMTPRRGDAGAGASRDRLRTRPGRPCSAPFSSCSPTPGAGSDTNRQPRRPAVA